MQHALEVHQKSLASLNQIIGIMNDDHRVRNHILAEFANQNDDQALNHLLNSFKCNFWDEFLLQLDTQNLVPAKEFLHEKDADFIANMNESIAGQFPILALDFGDHSALITFDYEETEQQFTVFKLMQSGSHSSTMRSLDWDGALHIANELDRVDKLEKKRKAA